ncbi:MAG: ribonuclease P protein component [Candidatus Omnitrophica bacterium]|nr:ribonuclease P protein component [Candidatus Omnitrophota bacterium]
MKQRPSAVRRAVNFSAVKRITRPGDYKRVYATGVKYFGRSLKVYIVVNNLHYTRIGVVVGRRVSLSAVARNRVKRILRHEASRRIQALSPRGPLDVVVVARPKPDGVWDSKTLREDLLLLSNRWPQ